MGFDISLRAVSVDLPPKEIHRALLEQFEKLEDFPIEAGNAEGRFWEINAIEGHWADVIITAWPDSIDLEIHSTPQTSCADELAQVKPLLDFLVSRGYVLENEGNLLEEYENQCLRVEKVRRMIDKE